MKTKLKHFIQHLHHEIEDEAQADEYIDNSLSYIGLIVMYFNSLESSLDSILCENFSDRTDTPGLIVLSKLNYSSKVDLFKRFCDDFHRAMNQEIDKYDQLINDLKESGRLRNLVIHANWASTNEEGFTYVKLKMSKRGMHQEYVQFTEESFQKTIELILNTTFSLYDYWEYRNEILSGKEQRKK